MQWLTYVQLVLYQIAELSLYIYITDNKKTSSSCSVLWEYLRARLHKLMSGMDRKHYIVDSTSSSRRKLCIPCGNGKHGDTGTALGASAV